MARSLGLALTLLLVACAPEPEPIEFDDTVRVETVAAAPAGTRERRIAATVEALHDVVVSVERAGRVIAVEVQVGDAVALGDALVRLDAGSAQAQQTIAEATVVEAEAAWRSARRQAERLEPLVTSTSDAERDAAQTAATRAHAAWKAARGRAELARTDLARTVVRAPFAGTVAWVGPSAGASVAPGTPAIRLVDDANRIAEIGLMSDEVTAVREGDAATVRWNGWTGEAHITSVSPASDPRTGQWPATLALGTGPAPLGASIEVTLHLPTESSAVRIPRRSVREDRVWTVRDGIVHAVRVQVEGTVDDAVLVTPLSEGDPVVTFSSGPLHDGAPVVELRAP